MEIYMTNYVDLLVVGNGINEVYQALTAARNGKSVVLSTNGEYLMKELSEALAGFFCEDDKVVSTLKEIGITFKKNRDGMLHARQGSATSEAMRALKDAGVYVLFDTVNIGLLYDGDTVCGGVFANKFGIFEVKSKNTLVHQEKNNNYFAFQLGRLKLGGFKTPCSLPDLGDIRNIRINVDSKADEFAIVSFNADFKNTYEAFDKALTLASHLRDTYKEFDDCWISKTAYTFEQPDFAVCEKISLADNFAEPSEIEINGKRYPLSEHETDAVLDDYAPIKMNLISISEDMTEEISSDVVIAGGGAGGMSAYMGLKENVKDFDKKSVLVVERAFLPGGTRTLGMVMAFWYGYTGGFSERNIANAISYPATRLKGYETNNFKDEYNSELMYWVNQLGDNVMFSTYVCGAKRNGSKIEGIYAARNGKIMFIKSKFYVDATGDADIAAFAGCEYVQDGNPRDEFTQSYSIWGELPYQVLQKDTEFRGDEDNISTERYSEYQRGIYMSDLNNSPDGFAPILTTRESRKIVGEKTVNMTDIVRQTVYEDTIAVSRCYFDAHGVGSQKAYFCSIFYPFIRKRGHATADSRIPLGAIVPKGMKNILVISKALSATRDAACLIRMNADVQNLGYSAGTVLSFLLNNNKNEVSLTVSAELKQKLIDYKILPDWYDKPSNNDLLNRIKNGDAWAATFASINEENREMLKAGFAEETNADAKYLFANALAAMGDKAALGYMLDAFSSKLKGSIYIAENTLEVMSDLVLLSHICDNNPECYEEFMPVFMKYLNMVTSGDGYLKDPLGIYANSKIHATTIANFKLLLATASIIEHVADPIFCAPLERLLKDRLIVVNEKADVFAVYIYLRLLAAAARCGSEKSKQRLADFANDEHVFFRHFVKNELDEIKSVPCPYTKAWDMWM